MTDFAISAGGIAGLPFANGCPSAALAVFAVFCSKTSAKPYQLKCQSIYSRSDPYALNPGKRRRLPNGQPLYAIAYYCYKSKEH
jgi:hypothetical protein